MRKSMKKGINKIVALIMTVSLLTACGNVVPNGNLSEKPTEETSKISEELKEKQRISDELLSDDEISYVMIYNPNIYDELAEVNDTLYTGEIADYVEAVMSKADGLAQPGSDIVPRSFSETNGELDYSGFDISGSRAGAFVTPYQKGDTHAFYCGDETRTLKTFTCYYAGENCNIWGCDNSITDAQAEDVGKEFDKNIYKQTTDIFGKSRFASNGGKVNLLFYPMTDGLGGFFHIFDLWATGEVSPEEISMYGINTDHDIVNINSKIVDSKEHTYPTIAHEFQHLICFTDFFETTDGINMRTWLNEAMSGYIEEVLYPGSKELSGHYEAFCESNRIRHGQSMYNFESTTTNMEWDIGVYGSVYLFSEYLASRAGDDIFSDIHKYWRTSYSSTLDESEAIAESVPSDLYDEVDNLFDYEQKIRFKSGNEEWLSKLTLDFYMSIFKENKNNPDAYKNIESQTLLYDEINPADIEGGGRVVVALKDGQFKFPTDADKGLVYIGFNKDFEFVTDYVVR